MSDDLVIPVAAVTVLLRGIAEHWRTCLVPDRAAAVLDMAGQLELECMAVGLTLRRPPED